MTSFKILIRLLLIGAVFQQSLFARSSPKVADAPGSHRFSIQFDGRERTYLLHIPLQYSPAASSPLVIVLHGGGGNAHNAIRITGMSAKADSENFLVAYPEGTGYFKKHVLTWNAANCCGYAERENVDDVGFIRAMLSELEQNYAVDPRRIYVTGMSNGGMMAFRLACEMSDKIAAIAPVATAFNDEECAPDSPVSIIMFNGRLDEHVLYLGGQSTVARSPRTDRPVAETIDFWVAHNECYKTFLEEERKAVVRKTFSGGAGGSNVVLFTIKNGGHAWPGGKKGRLAGDKPTRQISATELMWAFFVSHPKQ